MRSGRPYPLGATWDGLGVNFAMFSEHASQVELCLFDSAESSREAVRLTLPEQTDQIWHCFLPGVLPGQLCGYRVHGPHDPRAGHRFQGRAIRGRDVKDISWFTPSGHEMDDAAWSAHFVRTFGVRLSGSGLHELDDDGAPITGDTLYLGFNAHHERVPFVLPSHETDERWLRILDTARHDWSRAQRLRDRNYGVTARSLAVFQLVRAAPGEPRR